MKKIIFTTSLSFLVLVASAQLKVFSGGKISVGSTATTPTYLIDLVAGTNFDINTSSTNGYRINGTYMLWNNNKSGCVYVGGAANSSSTGTNNTFVGNGAAFSNSSGASNTFLGYTAGYTNTSGGSNTFLGYASGILNTTGTNNTFSGYSSGAGNTSGNYNTEVGYEGGYYNQTGSYNTYFGWDAGKGTANYSTDYNTFIGYKSGQVITTGTKNVFLGAHTGYSNTTGNYNTFTGYNTGVNNTSGGSNSCLGYYAGYYNATGDQNTCLGNEAGNGVTGNSYSYNTFIGYRSGYVITTGNSNTFIGHTSGDAITTGSYNTALGLGAGGSVTTGNYNTSVGYQSGATITTGSNNTFLGYAADVGTNNYSNCMALGNGAGTLIAGSNSIAVGNTSISSIKGQVAFTTFSDSRIKNNIQENVPGLDFINLLRPVTYHYDIDIENEILGLNQQENNNPPNDTLDLDEITTSSGEDWQGKYDIEQIQFSGFIAQEVNDAATQIGYDFSGIDRPEEDGGLWGLRYSEFIVPLVKAVQEQQTKIEELEAKLNECCSAPAPKSLNTIQYNEIQPEQNSGNTPSAANPAAQVVELSYSDNIILYQNIPNPFGEETTINYYLPHTVKNAKMVFFNNMGQNIKEVFLENKGNASVLLKTSELASGIYSYSLEVNGKVIETKKMLKNK